MKYIKQLSIILAISFFGEILYAVLPFPIPASIYGLLLMFFALLFHVIRLEDVQETANYLVEIMTIMFIPAAVGLITAFDLLRENLVAYVIIMVVSTIVVFFISGRVTQFFLRRNKGGREV